MSPLSRHCGNSDADAVFQPNRKEGSIRNHPRTFTRGVTNLLGELGVGIVRVGFTRIFFVWFSLLYPCNFLSVKNNTSTRSRLLGVNWTCIREMLGGFYTRFWFVRARFDRLLGQPKRHPRILPRKGGCDESASKARVAPRPMTIRISFDERRRNAVRVHAANQPASVVMVNLLFPHTTYVNS